MRIIEKTLSCEKIESSEQPQYKNPNLPIAVRVADLLSRMTLEEKVAQMLCIWRQKNNLLFDDQGRLDFTKLRAHFRHGLGQIARLSDSTGGKTPEEMAELANQIQHYFCEETRLGIPVVFHEECLHGLAAQQATSYPQPIGLASTFNPQLVEQIYAAVAEDARARGVHQALTPVIDVARDARWGRVEETFGEDPYLVAQMGIAAVKGFQGDGQFNDQKHLIATLKHFAAHGQPESGTNCGPANFSERLLRDVFLYPFREVIQKAKAISVMASYNEIDGIPSHANRWLLRDVLRQEWGFEGYVVSDYFAITELHHKEDTISHAVAKDKAEAALLAALAGVNIELPDMDCYPYLTSLVQSGRLPETVIDELVGAMLKYKFLLGLFENPYVHYDHEQHALRLEQTKPLALQAAHETIILLKNEGGLLPLDPNKINTIAVIGPNADRELLGGYSGVPPYFISVLEGIRQKVGQRCKVLYSEGCRITIGGSWNEDQVVLADPGEDEKLIAEAVATAQMADVVILVIGGNEQTSREAWSKTHLGDRPSLELLGRQNDLVKALYATGKPIIAVLFNGRPNAIKYIAQNIPAILECWYLGQECGRAVADVLVGDFNPGGKLPISIPRSVGHNPCYYNHKPSDRRGYHFDEITPLFPFGFGLSYTTFQIHNFHLEKSTIHRQESTAAVLDVTNTGPVAGTEVLQLYIRDVVSSVTRPVKELKGFQKVFLQPGETQRVILPITPEHLAFTNINKQYVVEPGEFLIMVGTSSRDADLQTLTLQVEE